MADIVKLIYKGDEMAQGGGSGSVPLATKETIGIVRGATREEWNDKKSTGDDGALLVVTPSEFYNKSKSLFRYFQGDNFGSNTRSNRITSAGETATLEIDGSKIKNGYVFLVVTWNEWIFNGKSQNTFSLFDGDHYHYSPISTYSNTESCSVSINGSTYYPEMMIKHQELISVQPNAGFTLTLTNDWTDTSITNKWNYIEIIGAIDLSAGY